MTDVCCCASCGIAGVDDVTLKDCDGGCDLVKYCSDMCQENHREHHDEECKNRAAEMMHDKQLFTQPDESCLGECSICCLPLPLIQSKYFLTSCCSKYICNGCDYANQKREFEAGLEGRCAFCREPISDSQEESDKRAMERAKKNDPVALTQMGKKCKEEGDYRKAFEYYTKAAELDHVDAHASLGILYLKGEGVEKDDKKLNYHLEQAAIGGHPQARYNLALYEAKNGRFERAKKHYIIAANLGDHVSLQDIKQLYVQGVVS